MTADPYHFNYSAAIAEIARDFPDAAQRLHFFDTAQQTRVPGHPDAERYLDDLIKNDAGFPPFLKQYMQELSKKKLSCVFEGSKNHHFVFLYNGPQDGGLLSTMPPTQRLHFILDHEMGHIVTTTGKPSKQSATLHESTADVYACAKHIQRYGRQTGAIEDLILLRAQRLVSLHGDRHMEHFTSFVLEKFADGMRNAPVEYLSPTQTATLASRMASAYTPRDQLVSDITKAFTPFKDMLAAGASGDDAYRTLAAIVLDNHDHHVFKWGAPVLQGYIDGRLRDMRNGEYIVAVNARPLTGDYWEKTQRTLKEKEFAFNRDGMLYGMDIKMPVAPSAQIKINLSL